MVAKNQFFKKFNKTRDGCWEWTGALNGAGYGITRVKGTSYRAHRYSYQIHVGPIPKGMLICHKCDNPKCVRPDHLFVGTPKDNSQDMVSKGRNMHKVCPETLARGDRNGTRTHPETVRKGEKIEWHKLNDKAVLEIRKRFSEGEPAVDLAKEYGVHKSCIYKAIYHLTWKHLP